MPVTSGKRGSGASLRLFLLMAILSLGGRAPATCRCGSGSLEVVLALDTTSSMQVMIGTVKEQIYRLMAALEGGTEKLRVGVVLYRSPEAPEYVTRTHPLTEDRKALVEWLRRARARGGGYEAVEKGLEEAVGGMKWTKGARKVIILVGDEAPHPQNRERCLKLARLAKSRGIAVNAVTCSMTAWSYWRLINSEEWKRRYRARGDRAKEEFQLPIFRQIAEAGGGLAVPSKDTRELLKWLLVIASGESDPESVDVEKFKAWDPAKQAAPAGSNPMIAQLSYSGGWATPRNFEALRGALARKVELDFDSAVATVSATDKKLLQYPLLYVRGHGQIGLSRGEKDALRDYLRKGGLLWADCCCARKEFDAAFRKLVGELFPGRRLAELPAGHPVYRAGYVIEKVSYAQMPRRRGTTFIERPPRLEGLSVSGRLAVLYSYDSLGCGWASYPLGAPCQLADPDALRLSINILLYALTADRREGAKQLPPAAGGAAFSVDRHPPRR